MRYDAFISYRHSEPDMFVAKRVHKGLETFKVPRTVAKKYGKKKIKRVFRDQEELPIGSDLGDNISKALEESEYLLVICSPRTPESYWVQKEIDTFIQLHDREHILAILIEGEPADSFPPQLLTDDAGNPVEPLAADVRGSSHREIARKLKTELMRLVAPILHCSYDDLKQRHRERRMRKMLLAASVVAVLGVAFGAYSAYNNAIISENYKAKQVNQSKYLAKTALELLEEGDRQTAALVALEALPSEKSDRPFVPAAQYALSRTLNTYDTGNVIGMDRSLKHELPVREFAFNLAGDKLISKDSGSSVYVWNVEDGELLAKIPPEIGENGYVIDPTGQFLCEDYIIICSEDKIICYDFSGAVVWSATLSERTVYCELDKERNVLACISGEVLTFVDAVTGEKLVEVPNTQEYSFSGAYAFNADGSRFAVSHIKSFAEEGEPGLFSVYDFAGGKLQTYETKASFLTELGFTADGSPIAVSHDHVDYKKHPDADSWTGYVEKLDRETGEVLWTREFDFLLFDLDTAGATLKTRKYTDDATGVTYDEVLLSIDRTAYTWDAMTGETLAEIRVTGGIKEFLVAKNSRFGYLAESNGTIDIVDMNTGSNYSSAAIETGKNLMGVSLQNGVLVLRVYASPDLTLMKYHEGAGLEEVETFEGKVDDMYYSPEETYYAVSTPLDSQYEKFSFYRTEDNTFVSEWNRQEGGYYAACAFMDEETFVYIDTAGIISFVDIATGVADTMQLYEDAYSMECDLNEAGTLALILGRDSGNVHSDTFRIIDLQKRQIVISGGEGEDIIAGVIAEDGSRAYCNTRNNGICIIDGVTGQMTPLNREEYRMVKGTEAQRAMAVSRDGTLLAVSCVDGVLRVLDTRTLSTVAEIPFAGANRRFIRFSEDSTELMLQGDDYYFRVYNLEQQQFTHIESEQYYEISKAIVDEGTGTISLVTSAEMIILDGKSYEKLAGAEKGVAYLPASGAVFCKYSYTLYRFPYMTLEMLLAEAEEEFAGKTLSQLERIQYNVE